MSPVAASPFVAPALLVAGGVLLWSGGDKFVEHAAHLARSFRVPKHVVGAVVLGFGTSLPELLVSLSALYGGAPRLATGNIIGSNITNITLILGLAAVIAPVAVEPRIVRLDLPLGLAAAIGLALCLYPEGGVLGRTAGLVLLAVFAGYMALSIVAARSHRRKTRDEVVPERRPGRDAAWLLVGLGVLLLGAQMFVVGAQGVARLLDVPEEVIALSVVALGTSLPELVTTVQAARQGHPELAVGNVAGSNIFNVFLVLGCAGVLAPLDFSPAMAVDVVLMGVASVLAFPLFGRLRRIPRFHGALLVAGYVGYAIYLFTAGRVV